VDVEEEHVHGPGGDLTQPLLGVGGPADDLDAAGGLHHPGQAPEGERLVVDQERAEGRWRHRVTTPPGAA
jgi:hypothetical protein